MRIHIVGLPHTETTHEFEWCAYTQKIRKLCGMLMDSGHVVFLYGGERNKARCTEFVPIIDRAWQAARFGTYDWSRDTFDIFDPNAEPWQTMNGRAIAEILKRYESRDYLGISIGVCQKQIADAFPGVVVETGIGYAGVFANYRVFESHAWAHHVSGLSRSDDCRFFDTVIPNSFEAKYFPEGTGRGGYDLFVGRFIPRKGIQIAAECTGRLGLQLKIAGQGVTRIDGDRIYGAGGFWVEGRGIEHLGVIDSEERAQLMGGARCVWVPTTYLEPFGGVAVEAMLCGTPVITTDWGAFTETVAQGISGYRCRTLHDFLCARGLVEDMDRAAIRQYALSKYTTDVLRHEYDRYFETLNSLWSDGWYSTNPK